MPCRVQQHQCASNISEARPAGTWSLRPHIWSTTALASYLFCEANAAEWVVWGQKINLLDRIQNQYSRVHHHWKSIILLFRTNPFAYWIEDMIVKVDMWCLLLSCKLKAYLYTCIKLYLYLSRQTFRYIGTNYFASIQKYPAFLQVLDLNGNSFADLY